MLLVREEVAALLRRHVKKVYGTQAEAARAWGVSSCFVSAMCCGDKPPPAYVLGELGLQRVIRYAPQD